MLFTEGKERPIEQICQLCANLWRWSERIDWQRGKVPFIYYVSTFRGGGGQNGNFYLLLVLYLRLRTEVRGDFNIHGTKYF